MVLRAGKDFGCKVGGVYSLIFYYDMTELERETDIDFFFPVQLKRKPSKLGELYDSFTHRGLDVKAVDSGGKPDLKSKFEHKGIKVNLSWYNPRGIQRQREKRFAYIMPASETVLGKMERLTFLARLGSGTRLTPEQRFKRDQDREDLKVISTHRPSLIDLGYIRDRTLEKYNTNFDFFRDLEKLIDKFEQGQL